MMRNVLGSTMLIVCCYSAFSLGNPAAKALDLQANLTNQSGTVYFKPGQPLTINFTGQAYNADTEGAFTTGGLRAFYHMGDFVSPFAVPDEPAINQLGFGGGSPEYRNSEFAANPVNNNNWWVTDDSMFRTNNGIADPGAASGQNLPPYMMRRALGDNFTTADDNFGFADNFGVRMEGRINIASSGNYTFNGGADDIVRVYVDGKKIFDNRAAARFNGNVTLTAGDHGFVAEFGEIGGGQNYSFNIPGGATLSATAQDEHAFAGARVEIGRTFAERRDGYLTAVVKSGQDGSGSQIGETFHYEGPVSDDFGNSGPFGPTGPTDNFRLILTGYWDVPTTGLYDFSGSADDRYLFAISNDPFADPNSIPSVMRSSAEGGPATADNINLTAGYKPVRFEFGEGGGGANFNFLWGLDGNAVNNQFQPGDLQTTEIPVFDFFETVESFYGQESLESLLASWDIPDNLVGQLLTARLTVVGTDQSFVFDEFTFTAAIVPEPTSIGLLSFGLVGLLSMRRRRRS